MQEHDNPRKKTVKTFLQEKGYYIVLILCVAAVGVSGYLFISGAVSEKNALKEETLSVTASAPAPVETSVATRTKTPAKTAPKAAEAEPAAKTIEVTPEAQDQAAAQTAAAIRVWPVNGETVSGYSMDALSYNETTRDWRTHDGIDLAAQTGAPVRAACGGTVSAVYDDEYLGTTVIISHADGYTTHYSNLAAMPAVSAGSTVSAGETIGAVGGTAILESGRQAHLHFAVYQNGESVDPESFVE